MDHRINGLLGSRRSGSDPYGSTGQSFASSTGGSAAGTLGPMIGGTSGAVAITRAGGGVADVASGRVSLAILEGIAIGLVVFYIWTHGLQDGL